MVHFELLWSDKGLRCEAILFSYDEIVGALRVFENYGINDFELKSFRTDE